MGNLELAIKRFLRTGEGAFDDLSLELFQYQFARNLPYQAYCRSQGIGIGDVRRWQDIPAVPVQAFKSAELATFPIGQAAAVFESSGTTQKTPSRHYLRTLVYYEASLKTSFENWVLNMTGSGPKNDQVAPLGQTPFLILTSPPSEVPHSSLSWMMDVVKRRWGAQGSQYFVRQGRLDELWLATMIAKMQASGTSAILLGTTIAYQALFEYCRKAGRRFVLPIGSRLMDTGGMKTHKRETSRPDFVRQAGEFLGIPEDHCINEYGMCEMSSQFYGKGSSTHLEGPAWVRTLVINPSTGREAVEGEIGLLRHFDLANVDSVMAIQTEDIGMKPSPGLRPPTPSGGRGAGGEGFILIGRAPEADVKGCSISAEAFLR